MLEMSGNAPFLAPVGRGKGGASRPAGRGKGGRFPNKKPKKVGMQNLTKPVIRRLARRGGIHRISGLLYESVREFSMKFLRKIICDAIVFMKHQCRKTITLEDVRRAATHNNITLLHWMCLSYFIIVVASCFVDFIVCFRNMLGR